MQLRSLLRRRERWRWSVAQTKRERRSRLMQRNASMLFAAITLASLQGCASMRQMVAAPCPEIPPPPAEMMLPPQTEFPSLYELLQQNSSLPERRLRAY